MSTPPPGPLHLLGVWNPSYADDPLDAHVRLLLDWLDAARQSEAPTDAVYVWWGRLRSPHRRGPIPHLDQIVQIHQQIDRNVETHLYLTDYRSLVVAEIDRVSERLDLQAERDHVPDYYRDHAVDVWFRVRDFRRLVSNDTLGVIDEVRKLRNIRYHHAPVSLYGGMMDLPLLVTHDDRPRWFAHRESLLEPGRLWAERDDRRQDVETLSAELRDHLFGRRIWNALTLTARSFLASAEAVYRSRRFDPAFDFSGVVLEYMKALEVELHDVLFVQPRDAVQRLSPERRRLRLDHGTIDPLDLVTKSPLTLGDVARALGASSDWTQALGRFYDGFEALRREWPAQLRHWADKRNQAAHKERMTLQDAEDTRERFLGIGCDGWLAQLGRLKERAVSHAAPARASRKPSPRG